MHAYRSHNCVELTEANVGQQVRLSGWINRKRDHGQLVFVDLRDHYGLTNVLPIHPMPALRLSKPRGLSQWLPLPAPF